MISTLWQRAKTAVSGFFSHAVGYIPRGIALTGVLFAGSAILEGATGATLLGISTASDGALLGRLGTHLALGSLISGVIGATSDVCCACKSPTAGAGAAAANNPLLSKSETQMGQTLVKTVAENGLTSAAEHAFSGSGLPIATSIAKNLGIH